MFAASLILSDIDVVYPLEWDLCYTEFSCPGIIHTKLETVVMVECYFWEATSYNRSISKFLTFR